LKINVYTEFDEDLERRWVEFEKNATITPFQSWAWLQHWHLTVGKPLLNVRPQIVVVHDEADTVFILPLCIRKDYGIKTLEWLGLHQADYSGPVVRDGFGGSLDSVKLWSAITKSLSGFDVIDLRRQSEQTVQFLDTIGLSSNAHQNLNSYQAKLPGTWDEYFGNIKKRIRSDSRRQQRRLEKLGEVAFIHPQSEDDKREIIQSMIKQKSRRYQDTSVWDMLASPEYQSFYEGLKNLDSGSFQVHCAALMVGDTAVATHVGVVGGGTFYYLMPAHAGGDWEKYSPGRLLLLKLIKWAIENELELFDFTHGEEAYKKDWCDRETNLFQISQSVSMPGRLFSLARSTNTALKKVPAYREFKKAPIYRKLVSVIRK